MGSRACFFSLVHRGMQVWKDYVKMSTVELFKMCIYSLKENVANVLQDKNKDVKDENCFCFLFKSGVCCHLQAPVSRKSVENHNVISHDDVVQGVVMKVQSTAGNMSYILMVRLNFFIMSCHKMFWNPESASLTKRKF